MKIRELHLTKLTKKTDWAHAREAIPDLLNGEWEEEVMGLQIYNLLFFRKYLMLKKIRKICFRYGKRDP